MTVGPVAGEIGQGDPESRTLPGIHRKKSMLLNLAFYLYNDEAHLYTTHPIHHASRGIQLGVRVLPHQHIFPQDITNAIMDKSSQRLDRAEGGSPTSVAYGPRR